MYNERKGQRFVVQRLRKQTRRNRPQSFFPPRPLRPAHPDSRHPHSFLHVHSNHHPVLLFFGSIAH